uniref:PDZ domain-containing protein n=1 Tax=Takifugu rubripes TaxID=31033 RepID=A0A674MAI9_TAKRU
MCWQDPPSPESGVIVKTAKDGCAEGLVYGGGGKDGIFIKEVVPESPASRSLNLKEGDQVLSATVYFDNMSYEDAMQILEHGHTALQEDLTGPDANERSKGTSAKVEMPKVEFDISNVAFLHKSPHKIEDKKKKGKDKKTKTKDANYKLPKVGL